MKESRDIIYYTCDYCGSSTSNRLAIEECEEFGQRYIDYEKADLQPYHWYRLHQRQNGKEEFVFCSEFKFVKSWSSHRCSGSEVRLYDAQYNQYFDLISKWKIIEVVSMEDAVRLYQQLPYIGYGVKPPTEIKTEIIRIIKDAQDKRRKEIDEMSIDELRNKVKEKDELLKFDVSIYGN